ncbi:MAG: DUF3089 domain-containing protein [Bacteroidia bacterium]
MPKNYYLLSFLFIFAACTPTQRIAVPFENAKIPPAPDYSQASAWSALPDKADYADKLPIASLKDGQKEAQADVFYIHPTTLFSHTDWNGNISDSLLNFQTDTRPVMNQATVFNGSCKVYAPRYRQMTLDGFYTKDTASKWKAAAIAYQDVKAAFEYYLKHYNNGRPFILAAHSQGTVHGLKLLREMVDGKELQNQLVAAYLIGFAFRPDTLKYVKVCDAPNQTGCVMHWASFREGTYPEDKAFYEGAVNVNPISWKMDNQPTKKEEHLGVLWQKFEFKPGKKLRTQRYKGVLWVENPLKPSRTKSYHIGDYNLFWLNIRNNVDLRVKTFLEKK